MRDKACFLMLFAVLALAVDASATNQGFFSSEEPVRFRLEAPISTLMKQRGSDPDWLEAKITLLPSEPAIQALDVRIKARGNFRRQSSSCKFPSYWINFKKKQVKGTEFAGLDKVKIVAHCREGRKSFAPYIYKEYLAYKTYNILTDRSFRVRLAEIEYVNTQRKNATETYVAFFIEHVDDFAARYNAKQVKDRHILPELYNPRWLALAEMYQFFVGNTDFSFFASQEECCHNGKTFATADDYLPVAYDFDLTGLVNVPYAKVNPKLPIKKATDRYYRGTQMETGILNETLQLFIDKKEAIYSLWENTPYLPDKEKVEALRFIDEFYAIIEDPERLQAEVVHRMRSTEKLTEVITERISGQDQ